MNFDNDTIDILKEAIDGLLEGPDSELIGEIYIGGSNIGVSDTCGSDTDESNIGESNTGWSDTDESNTGGGETSNDVFFGGIASISVVLNTAVGYKNLLVEMRNNAYNVEQFLSENGIPAEICIDPMDYDESNEHICLWKDGEYLI